jgi:DHA2 family multidrug resistance protein
MNDYAGWKPRVNPWLIAVVTTVAAFMEVLDTTIVNVSLPHIAGSLSCSYGDATWALTSYLVANGIVVPISGWLSDVIGRKRYFMLCIAMFTVCSLLCGLAQNLAQLIFFRMLQGFFGGGLQPTHQAILLDTFPQHKRAQAMSVVSIAVIAAPVMGPIVGGWITDTISWRWTFFLNIPIGIAGVLAIAALVEDPPWVKARRSKGVDYIGIGLIALGLGALQMTLDRGEGEDWFASPFIRVTALVAVIATVGAVLWLLSTKKPVVNLFILCDRNFAISTGLLAAINVPMMGATIVFPQFAQNVLGYTAEQAGLIVSPGSLAVILMTPVVARMTGRIDARQLIACGFIVITLAMWHASFVTPDIGFGRLAAMRAFQAVGMAFLFVPISTLSYSTLSRENSQDAASLGAMFRNLSGAIGISLSTTIIAQHTVSRQADLVSSLNSGSSVYRDMLARYIAALQSAGHLASEARGMAVARIYSEVQRQASILAFADEFRVGAVMVLLVMPSILLYSRQRHRP